MACGCCFLLSEFRLFSPPARALAAKAPALERTFRDLINHSRRQLRMCIQILRSICFGAPEVDLLTGASRQTLPLPGVPR